MHRGFPMEASAPKKKRPLAAIPENLEELSKPELIKIIESLRRVAEAPQGSLGQGGGEGHQAESGGSPRERRHRRQWAALGTDFKI